MDKLRIPDLPVNLINRVNIIQKAVKSSMRILFIFLLIALARAQSNSVVIQPDNTYNLTFASPNACYANCQSCQIMTFVCEECEAPYFSKSLDGSCVVSTGYSIQSTSNELLAGPAFIYSNESWINAVQTDCQPNPTYLNAPLRILGPFTIQQVSYRRTLAFHQYIVIRFLLLKMNWQPNTYLNINVTNENGAPLYQYNVNYSDPKSIPTEILCSSTKVDQRFAVMIEIYDQKVGTVNIGFNFGNSNSIASWGISTFTVLTGSCDPSCSSCSFSNDPTSCVSCKQFLDKGAGGRCNQCTAGFNLSTANTSNIYCQKCPIEYLSCNPGQEVCFYKNLTSDVNKTNCKFNTPSNYLSIYDVNTDVFSGSLLTVNGKSSLYQCGLYSIVGLAQNSYVITRIYENLGPHIAVSFTFNVFKVDQVNSNEQNIFVLMLDNNVIEASLLGFPAISNVCGDVNNEAYETYPATRFYPHTNMNNVNFSIASNASNWGIRNLRIALQVCEKSCLNCTPNGCQQCPSLMQLVNLSCSQCISGYGLMGIFGSPTSYCEKCQDNCVSCNLTMKNNVTASVCLQCSSAYYIFEGNCLKLPNIGATTQNPDSTWKPVSLDTNSSCSINLPSYNGTNTTKTFVVAQNNLNNSFTFTEPHYKMIVEFYLMKIDNWDPTDTLELYLNDLLVMQKNFTNFGNQICFNNSQTQQVSFQQFSMMDNNNSLTASFEVISRNGSNRTFGIADFKAYPVGCQACQNYDFSYKTTYNYDKSLNVYLQFNRVYENYDPDEFKKIFHLYVNGKRMNYTINMNNSVNYVLQTYPTQEQILSNVTVYCKYPQRITTNIQNSINSQPFFSSPPTSAPSTSTMRLLQQTDIQNTKSLNNTSSQFTLQRFTPVSNLNGISGIRTFFQVISRIVIYVGFFSFFIGCQTSCTHMMHNVQRIWVHIFVASLAMPSILKFALMGFSQTQNQNIAIHPSVWQVGIPRQLYYDCPPQYVQYTDITFLRNIYNIGFAFAILLVYSIIMYCIFNRTQIPRQYTDQTNVTVAGRFIRHMKITFAKRPYFVFNSVIFYQYLTLVLACTLQFIDLKTRSNFPGFRGANAAGAIVAFILATVYPIIHYLYLHYKKIDMTSDVGYIDRTIAHKNRYAEIFYRFLPPDIWILPQSDIINITFIERIYNVFRFGQIWWLCLIVSVMNGSPQAQCYLLMITNFLHMVLVLFSSLNYTIYFRLLKVFELAFFVGLEILILVCASATDTLTQNSYQTLAYVAIAFIFAIIFLSLIRVIYTFWKIYKEYDQKVAPSVKTGIGIDYRLRSLSDPAFYDSYVVDPYENAEMVANEVGQE